jgi:hypothetical protein
VQNSYDAGGEDESNFLTKPEQPEEPTVAVEEVNATQITLSWTKGVGAQRTMVRRKVGEFPADRFDGDLVYFDTGTTCIDTGLDPGTVYYYRLWSQVSGSEQWSDYYDDITVQTSNLTPTPTTTTTTTTSTTGVVSVGGSVYPVNKAGILAPWIAGTALFLLLATGFILRVTRLHKKP